PLDASTKTFVGPPARKVQDQYPAFAAVAVDPVRDEVILTDENLFQVLAYNRLDSSASDAITTPKRVIAGENTLIEFESGVHVDPQTGDIIAPNNDTVDTLVVFKHGSSGDAAPIRALKTPHGTFGIAVDDRRNEMFLTTQHDATVVVFRKDANKDDAPLRLLQGDHTGLADPHGIAIDPQKDVFYVANYGSHALRRADREIRTGVPGAGKGRDKANWPVGREYAVPGSGTNDGPSISVHAITARGDDRPLRTIKGSQTQLNWPTGLAFDPVRRELFVANDMGPSILVFDADATGNAAPKRVLKGPHTGLAHPTSVSLDAKNGELWVANFGGHSATAYPIDAAGDTAPLRTIRSAPASAPSLMIGNPGALTYDTTREEILVPNCVAHPQIAVFARSADGNAPRTRAIEGQTTGLGRTMHGIDYDERRDEIIVPQQFGQAILIFKGSAAGETPPIRVIQGSRTMLTALDRVAVDSVNDEIYVPEGDRVLVFDLLANGNVAPKRVLGGPETGFTAAGSVAIDPTRNIIIVGAEARSADGRGLPELAIFDRTASGNTKPKRVITGLKSRLNDTGNIRIYPQGGLVFATQQTGYVAVWSVDDDGDVPPRYTVGGPHGLLQKPRGLDLDPKHNAVIVSDKQLNAVLTYEMPQLFQATTVPQSK
ncbi:MAG TPA: beta-propeller fold lactonase family protein, partial [Vicinamibacterales bacterium]|nr:beta-propeller fold lactonase family protein [Vicinamibacterales bacterium]